MGCILLYTQRATGSPQPVLSWGLRGLPDIGWCKWTQHHNQPQTKQIDYQYDQATASGWNGVDKNVYGNVDHVSTTTSKSWGASPLSPKPKPRVHLPHHSGAILQLKGPRPATKGDSTPSASWTPDPCGAD